MAKSDTGPAPSSLPLKDQLKTNLGNRGRAPPEAVGAYNKELEEVLKNPGEFGIRAPTDWGRVMRELGEKHGVTAIFPPEGYYRPPTEEEEAALGSDQELFELRSIAWHHATGDARDTSQAGEY